MLLMAGIYLRSTLRCGVCLFVLTAAIFKTVRSDTIFQRLSNQTFKIKKKWLQELEIIKAINPADLRDRLMRI